ncbi:hypothetical protein [Nonomuraea sp. JJY05]|uniref:hypothetical protein n=1 Tax=Nonomuraea sp. JJY05 TaxID=3350255 RepID=UPI00373F072A
MTLFVETEDGVLLRRVPSASQLPEGEIGAAAERATKHAAMYWGLPDFVFRSAVRTRGRGVRELGDVIVCVGDVAAVVQVKARATVTADSDREASWLGKKIPQAISQAKGTLRNFAKKERDLLVNERGNQVELTYSSKSWVPVVVVDHPAAVGFLPPPGAVVLSRGDWEFLFDQLKSTYAVISYLHRVHDLEPKPLGEEPVRYYELAAADAAAPPTPLDLSALRGNASHASTPLLPRIPAGSEDYHHHLFLQQILEDIADCPRPEGVNESEFLDVLAAIDTMPVGHRTEMGKLLTNWLDQVARTPSGQIGWRVRRYLRRDAPHLVFATASSYTAQIQEAFGWLVRLRHQHLTEAMPEMQDVLTAGILLTPRHDGRRPWDTTLCATFGEQNFTPEEREALESLWPYQADYPALAEEDPVNP